MKQGFLKASIILRSAVVIGAVMALAGGATYAALQSQATLTDNTISSATTGLEVSTNNSTFSSSEPGFSFTGVVPGTTDSGTKNFWLKNTGSSDMSLNLSIPSLPTFTVMPSGTVDTSKVHLAISCNSTTSGTMSVNDTLSHLFSTTANFSGGPLKAGDTVACTAKVSMDTGAFTGSSASSSPFNLVFTGSGA